jgi:hypothetical protein
MVDAEKIPITYFVENIIVESIYDNISIIVYIFYK